MASGATIRVCVLEGQYAQLSNLGFPVSLVMELQQGGLSLDNAKWSSCLSDTGFSVSFFWPVAWTTQRHWHRRRRRKPRANPNSGNFTTTTVSKQQCKSPPIPSFSREGTLASRQPVLTDAHPSSSSSGSCSSGATSAVVDGEVPLPHPSSQDPPLTVGPDDSVDSDISVSSESEVTIADSNSPPQAPLPLPSSQDSSATMDSDVSESSESEAATSDSAQSNGLLQHLEDAEMVEYEIKNEQPGVKYTTDGRAGWTPISIRNRFSTRSDEYDVKYLRRCEQIRIYNCEKAGWRASIQSGSTLFSTPIAARTRSRTCRDVHFRLSYCMCLMYCILPSYSWTTRVVCQPTSCHLFLHHYVFHYQS